MINFLGTRSFGECEFWFGTSYRPSIDDFLSPYNSANTASIKVVTIIGLIILGLVIDLGGAPDHDRRGFRYWVRSFHTSELSIN